MFIKCSAHILAQRFPLLSLFRFLACSITYTTADDGDGDGDGDEKGFLSLFKTINSDGKHSLSKKEWRENNKEDEPEVTSGKTRFRDADGNNNNRTCPGEFKKFYERLIKE